MITWKGLLVHDTTLLRNTESSRRAAAASAPRIRVAKDVLVINKENGLSRVRIELVLSRPAIIANKMILVAYRKLRGIARPVFTWTVQAFIPREKRVRFGISLIHEKELIQRIRRGSYGDFMGGKQEHRLESFYSRHQQPGK